MLIATVSLIVTFKTFPNFHIICLTEAHYFACSIKDQQLFLLTRRATKLVPSLRHLPYPDRLKACNLTITTLHYRQIRGDMIETYKIVSGKYDSTIAPALLMSDTHITRGNELRLQKFRCKYDMRKFYFTN